MQSMFPFLILLKMFTCHFPERHTMILIVQSSTQSFIMILLGRNILINIIFIAVHRPMSTDASLSQQLCILRRAVASLTVPGGQEFHFPHFSPNFDHFFLFFLKLFPFSSSFWLSGWGLAHPGRPWLRH